MRTFTKFAEVEKFLAATDGPATVLVNAPEFVPAAPCEMRYPEAIGRGGVGQHASADGGKEQQMENTQITLTREEAAELLQEGVMDEARIVAIACALDPTCSWTVNTEYDGGIIWDASKWTCSDDSGTHIQIEADDAEDAAQEYVDGGDWGDGSETVFVTVTAWRDGIDSDGKKCRIDESSHTITIDPTEPECEDGEDHDWQSPLALVGGIESNPGVFGKGGGALICEACMRCGCGKTTDTWAQNPSNGQQGLTSVSYEAGKYQIERDDEE